MARLDEMLAEARTGLSPWDRIDARRLVAIGRRCGPQEVAEAIEALDRLAGARDGIPDHDGDAHDDVSRAAEVYMHVLAAVPASLLADILKGFRSPRWRTRMGIGAALDLRGGPAERQALREAAAREADDTVRRFLEDLAAR